MRNNILGRHFVVGDLNVKNMIIPKKSNEQSLTYEIMSTTKVSCNRHHNTYYLIFCMCDVQLLF